MALQPTTSTAVYTERLTCRICDTPDMEPVLDLGNQYLSNFTRVRDDHLPRAPLELVRCHGCGTLQLKHSVQPDLMWREYHYRSSINQTMRTALADVVSDGNHYAREGVWIDIGANDGQLLSRVPERFTKVGVEPALNMLSLLEEHADRVIPDYFSAEAVLAELDHADVVTSCAVFYDLDDPNRFVADVAKVLGPSGVWINQLNDAPTMMKNNAWDGICHEHRLYLDVPTIQRMYSQAGLAIVGLSYNDINGGSVRIAAMKAKKPFVNPTAGIPSTLTTDAIRFADRVKRWKLLMTEMLNMPSVRNHELWGLGASTKACCSLQYLDMNDRIVAIGDRNPQKTGTFMAGTGLPVLDEATMRKAKPANVLNLVWSFKAEVLQREQEMLNNGTRIINVLPHPEWIV